MVTSKLSFVVKNARIVRLSGGVLNLDKVTNEEGDIIKLHNDQITLTVGDVITPKTKYPFKFNYIYPVISNNHLVGYDLLTAKTTNSSIFAFPFLGGNRNLFMWDSLFINCFIGSNVDDAGNTIALLYRFSGEQLFLKFEEALCSFRSFRAKFDPDPYHVLFVFNVPESAIKSYEHFINGRYSQIDDIWKLKILEFHKFDIDGYTGKVLFQTESLRRELEQKLDIELSSDSELHSIVDMNTEVFNPQFYLHDVER